MAVCSFLKIKERVAKVQACKNLLLRRCEWYMPRPHKAVFMLLVKLKIYSLPRASSYDLWLLLDLAQKVLYFENSRICAGCWVAIQASLGDYGQRLASTSYILPVTRLRNSVSSPWPESSFRFRRRYQEGETRWAMPAVSKSCGRAEKGYRLLIRKSTGKLELLLWRCKKTT